MVRSPGHSDSIESHCSAQVVDQHILEFIYCGYISRAMCERSFERAEALLAEHPAVDSVIFNVLDSLGHDPGNSALGIRWVATHKDLFRRSVLLTRSHTIAALSNVSKVLLPWLDTRVATERAEALALVREPARTQHKSGNYPKVRRTRAA